MCPSDTRACVTGRPSIASSGVPQVSDDTRPPGLSGQSASSTFCKIYDRALPDLRLDVLLDLIRSANGLSSNQIVSDRRDLARIKAQPYVFARTSDRLVVSLPSPLRLPQRMDRAWSRFSRPWVAVAGIHSLAENHPGVNCKMWNGREIDNEKGFDQQFTGLSSHEHEYDPCACYKAKVPPATRHSPDVHSFLWRFTAATSVRVAAFPVSIRPALSLFTNLLVLYLCPPPLFLEPSFHYSPNLARLA